MSESIKVVCRVRPLNGSEIEKGSKCVVTFPGDGNTSVAINGKTFAFDHVIPPQASQTDVYEVVAKPIVASVLNGYNGTVFAYGQTSSGKTFTMEGVLNDPVYQGIIPRIIHDIFNHIYQMDENLEFHIKVSYFEIYMEKIRDLLDVTKTNLSVHEDKDRVPFVKGATERFVSNPEEVFDVIDEGKSNRHVAVTNMNEHSSRSHSVFMIQVRQENLETQKKLHGKLYLVDLAGSEKVSKTGAEGTVLDEAKNINKSLSSLGNVINALVEGSAHVPYRDSKLTRILQESLGGNSRTTMIICCSPAAFNESETKSTLMFGMRAKTIKNCVQVNEELTADEWRRRFEREKERNRRLRLLISKMESELEKWRTGETVTETDWFSEETAFGEDPTSDDIPSTIESEPLEDSSSKNPITPDGRFTELYKQLDDKDDEINSQAQNISQLQQQVDEYEELIKTLRLDNDRYQIDINQQQALNDASKEEVKEVLQALEELAVNYEEKDYELKLKSKTLEQFQEKISSLSEEAANTGSELQQWRENCNLQKRKYTDMLLQLMKDIQDVAETLTDQIPRSPLSETDKLEEEFTVVRLHTNKLKSEAKSLTNRQKILEQERLHHHQLVREAEENVKEVQLRIQELETKIVHQSNRLEEMENHKRRLMEENDSLRAEKSKLQANVQLESQKSCQNQEIVDGQESLKMKLDEEFKRQSEQHMLQLKLLRDELGKKVQEIEELQDNNSHLLLQYESMKDNHSKLSSELEAKNSRLDQLEKQVQRSEQCKADLKGLEETVFKELQTLHNLRRLFVQELQTRMKKSAQIREQRQKAAMQKLHEEQMSPVESRSGESASSGIFEDDMSSSGNEGGNESIRGGNANKQKITFLESNLEQLTKVHKQLVRDNADLRSEVPKLEKRLKATMERVKSLETSLKDAKEAAVKDRRRYQSEVDRIKEHVRQYNSNSRRVPSAQIVKPIRAGHVPQSYTNGSSHVYSISGGSGSHGPNSYGY